MFRMLRIARREYIASVCTKGFVVGLILAPILMAGGLIGVAVTERQNRHTERRVAVIDHTGKLADTVVAAAVARNRGVSNAAGKSAPATYHVEIVPPNPADPQALRLELSDRIRAGGLHAFVEIGSRVVQSPPGSEDGRIRYHARNPALDEVRSWLGNVVNDRLRQERLLAAGIDPAAVTNLFQWVSPEGMGLIERDARTGVVQGARRQNEAAALGVPLVVAMFGMMLMLMGSTPLLQSVMEEKTQRIAEVMLGAATPWDIMGGKLLGGVAVALTAMVVYLGATFVTLASLAATNSIRGSLIPWFVAYVIAAILLYGAVAIALGAACSDARDAQQLQLPVMLPVMLPLFLLLPVIKEPQGALATTLSLCPPFTPLLMLIRMAAPGGVPAWQPWVGLAGVLAAAAAALWLGSRIFRIGILAQGKMPRLAEILRWGIRG
jgi:ABC-2 type transport system permease protein